MKYRFANYRCTRKFCSAFYTIKGSLGKVDVVKANINHKHCECDESKSPECHEAFKELLLLKKFSSFDSVIQAIKKYEQVSCVA